MIKQKIKSSESDSCGAVRPESAAEEVIDRLAGLLPEEALQQALPGSLVRQGRRVVIVGGDCTGKMLVPEVEDDLGTYRVDFEGERLRVRAAELEPLERRIQNNGFYPMRMTEARTAGCETIPKRFPRSSRSRCSRLCVVGWPMPRSD